VAGALQAASVSAIAPKMPMNRFVMLSPPYSLETGQV